MSRAKVTLEEKRCDAMRCDAMVEMKGAARAESGVLRCALIVRARLPSNSRSTKAEASGNVSLPKRES